MVENWVKNGVKFWMVSETLYFAGEFDPFIFPPNFSPCVFGGWVRWVDGWVGWGGGWWCVLGWCGWVRVAAGVVRVEDAAEGCV